MLVRLLAISFLVCLQPAIAFAQEAAPPADQTVDPRRDEEARSLFDAGRFAFEDGRFEEALSLFRRSYDLSHRSQLLYNIGSAAERLHRNDEAIAAFEQYLTEMPDVGNRGEIQRRIQLLREAGTTPPPDDGTTPPPDDGATPPPDDGATDTPTDTTTEESTQSRGTPFPIGTVIAGGAAVTLGVLSAVFWASANGSYSDLEDSCGTTRSCTQADVDDSGAPTAVTLTNVFLVGSIAAAAAAGVLAVIELGGGEDETQVGIGPSHIELRGRF